MRQFIGNTAFSNVEGALSHMCFAISGGQKGVDVRKPAEIFRPAKPWLDDEGQLIQVTVRFRSEAAVLMLQHRTDNRAYLPWE